MTARASADRRRAMLRTAMGSDIAAALADRQVVEVMVNPDGVLRLDRLGEGRIDTGIRLEPEQVEPIIRLVAAHARAEPRHSADHNDPPRSAGSVGCSQRRGNRARARDGAPTWQT